MDRKILLSMLALALAATTASAQPEEAAPSPAFGVGLDVLVRGENAGNFDLRGLTFAPGRDEAQLLLRLRPSASAESAHFGARVEGQWYGARGAEAFSEGSFYQGYGEARLPGKAVLRAGRQELVYGSAFLLGADSFYDGLSFDALKLRLQSEGGLSGDFFGGKYVRRNSGGIEGELYGAYATYAPSEAWTFDLYLVRDTGGAGLTHRDGLHEQTYSMGARLAAKLGEAASFEIEPVYQFGRKMKEGPSHDDIRAFGGHADLTVGSEACPWKFLLSYAYGSGDGDSSDGTFREFHNPNNDTPLVGDIGLVGDLSGVSVGEASASGLQVFTAGLVWQPAKAVEVSVDAHRFVANRVPEGFSRDVGVEANLIVTYRIRENVSALVSVNRFFTGQFFRDASGSGRDVDYAYVQLQASL